MKSLLSFLICLPLLFKAQIVFEQNIDLGTIPEASEIKGDVILKNQSVKKIFLMRADADQGVKVYTSKKVLMPDDTCLIIISFVPESGGRFKKRIGLVSSDKATPYDINLSGLLTKFKANDKTACYYFGARKNNSTPVKEDPIVVNNNNQPRDNSNRLPDSSPQYTAPALSSKETTPVLNEPSKELSATDYKPNNILFLVDVSGSMRDSLKLPLMKEALYTLIDAVRDIDKITFVTYADSIRVISEAIPGSEKDLLRTIVHSLRSKGLTKGNKAILFSQQLAQKHFIQQGNNQIFLSTDGKFRFYPDDVKTWKQRQANGKIIMSTVAFGNDREAIKNLKEIASNGEGSFIHIKKRSGSKEKLLDEVKERSKR